MTSSNEPADEGAPTIRTASSRRPTRIRSAMVEPAEDTRLERIPVWAEYVAAVVFPLAVAIALIPFREDLQQTAALLMILPVIAVALIGGARPAVVAALSAGGSFAVLLTEPYGQFAIHQGTDVLATVVLLVVGLVVGVSAVREWRSARRAELRREELEHLVAFAELSASDDEPGQLVGAAGDHVRELLHLDRCDWSTEPHDGGRPLVLDDGQIMGYLQDLPDDRSQLPRSGAVLLAQTPATEVGSFLLVPADGTTTSIEQRRTAATIANLLALALERSASAGRNATTGRA